ncbi:MAG: hypothetical protein ACM3TT_09110, partial [Syntrophothermus sp.]
VNIALITDYDAGLEGQPEIEAVSHEAVLKVFNENNEKLKKLLYEMIEQLPAERAHCTCGEILKHARG